MNILILTGYTGFRHDNKFFEAGKITAQNKFNYAMKHGYNFHVFRSDYQIYKDPVSWYKIEWMEKHLSEYDYIFWSDADVLITNSDIKIEDLIERNIERPSDVMLSPVWHPARFKCPALESVDYVVSADDYSPCMGNFIIKNSEWGHKMLASILSLKDRFYNDNIWDQRAQDSLFANNNFLMKNVKFLPKRSLNAMIPDWQDGDFLIHFPATGADRMMGLINKYLPFVK